MDIQQHVDRPFGQRPDGKTTISFFSASASRVCQAFVEWGREIGTRYSVHCPLPGTWQDFLGDYIAPTTRDVLVPTYGEWCAFIDNNRIGGMPFGPLSVIPERLGIRSASFIVNDLHKCREEKNPYSAMFGYCDATQGRRGEGAVERYVALVWNGGGVAGNWEYHENGTPLPFEEVEAYKSRKKADRLTPDMLIRYARALGIRLDKGDSFYNLREAIGLTWTWAKSEEESTNVILGMADKINKELGNKWKLSFFRR